jgi:hemolysin III
VWTAAVYGTTLVLLYGASTVYHAALARFHAVPRARVEAVLQRIDHSAIYLLIAGTYTPFVLVPLRGAWGWSLFGVVWGLAVVGIALKAVFGARLRALSTTVYVLMGWLIVVALGPLTTHVHPSGLRWLLAGGLFYTGGVVFYAWDGRVRYGHALWHLFVLGGSVSHFCAVLWYAVPRVG